MTAFGRSPAVVDTARNPLFTRFTIYIDLNWCRISAASPVALAIPFLHAPPKNLGQIQANRGIDPLMSMLGGLLHDQLTSWASMVGFYGILTDSRPVN